MTCTIVMFALHMGSLPPSRPSTLLATCRPLVARSMTRPFRLSAPSMSGDVGKEGSEIRRVAVDYVQGPDDRSTLSVSLLPTPSRQKCFTLPAHTPIEEQTQ